MSNSNKKPWLQPKLIVLVRAGSEENVLAACKGDGSRSSNTGHNGGCFRGSNCFSTCSSIAGS